MCVCVWERAENAEDVLENTQVSGVCVAEKITESLWDAQGRSLVCYDLHRMCNNKTRTIWIFNTRAPDQNNNGQWKQDGTGLARHSLQLLSKDVYAPSPHSTLILDNNIWRSGCVSCNQSEGRSTDNITINRGKISTAHWLVGGQSSQLRSQSRLRCIYCTNNVVLPGF